MHNKPLLLVYGEYVRVYLCPATQLVRPDLENCTEREEWHNDDIIYIYSYNLRFFFVFMCFLNINPPRRRIHNIHVISCVLHILAIALFAYTPQCVCAMGSYQTASASAPSVRVAKGRPMPHRLCARDLGRHCVNVHSFAYNTQRLNAVSCKPAAATAAARCAMPSAVCQKIII